MRKVLLLGAAMAVVLVTSGCGEGAGGAGGPTGSIGATGSPTPSSSTPGEPTPTAAGELVLTGVLVEALRPTCRVLDTGDHRYSLVGPGTQTLGEGTRVRVVGTPRGELVSPCGLTFAVRALTVL